MNQICVIGTSNRLVLSRELIFQSVLWKSCAITFESLKTEHKIKTVNDKKFRIFPKFNIIQSTLFPNIFSKNIIRILLVSSWATAILASASIFPSSFASRDLYSWLRESRVTVRFDLICPAEPASKTRYSWKPKLLNNYWWLIT